MAENSKIEWCDHTFNPVIGCQKVSQGCKFCYAEELMDKRYGKAKWGVDGTRMRTSVENWKKPLQWNRKAEALGVRYKVFCASLSDVFEEHPGWVEPRRDLLRMIAVTPHLDWLLLTKRPENILRQIEESATHLFAQGGVVAATRWLRWLKHGVDYALPNVWIGASVEDQEQADRRIPELLEIPATIRFLSMEPLLGDVDISVHLIPSFAADDPRHYPKRDGIEWVVVGGESGRNARPMHPDWVKSIRDQCVDSGRTAFFFKQWGEYAPTGNRWYGDLMRVCRECGEHSMHGQICRCSWRSVDSLARWGKHNAGRMLDGAEWSQVPKTI